MGLSKNIYSDFLHHPLKQGFDFFYGIPLSNMRDFDDLEQQVLMGIFPNLKYGTAGVLLATYLFIFCCRRVGSIGPKRFLFFIIVSSCIILYPIFLVSNFKVFNSILMRNLEVVEQPIRLPGITHRLVQEGVEFMERQVEAGKPFLLFMSWLQTHTALHAVAPFAGQSKHGTCTACECK